MRKNAMGFLVVALLFCGCATIMNGDMVNVPVYSTPSGATVIVNGATYTSPATIMVPRGKGDFKLHIEKEGYQPIDIMLTQSLDGWLWGNLLFGGIIGIAVDFISGDAYDIAPELVNANLSGVKVSKLNNGGLQFVLVDINQMPESMVEKIKNNSRKKS